MLLSAIIFGLLGSFHCIGMCGPIAFMLPVDRSNQVKQFFQIISYHLGRIISYGIIGFLFGLLGKGFQLFGFQQQVSIITGALMILAIILPSLFKKIKITDSLSRMVIKLKSALGKELKKKRNDTFFTIGFLNGFLPCGLVYMAILGAIAMSTPLKASIYMALFGLGTIPLMSAVVYAGNFATGVFRKRIQQIIPILVVFIGILFILRGLGLGIPFLSPPTNVSTLTEAAKGCH
ncbi:sulfite exporter TauE/SafE family protein [Tenacibaculum sp. IB213877]|uniref:sulfite exporter TauE/SafE family protein n=1 Tax=Tenacibaculum sp. IB213877 TaxID=3097351 RepID=UPI002A5ADCBB|nr:sulfite exporter TauE/SafE family protein [Tenacibaculum sp. IB213877]MDY0781404.1 sulfite exporter TauE/SafE family protein [Tenacibaculum sp. IB213877]